VHGQDAEPATGYLVVRASGAEAVAAAIGGMGIDGDATRAGIQAGTVPRNIQLLMRCPLRGGAATRNTFEGCSLVTRPVDGTQTDGTQTVVMLTVAAARLSIGFEELRPLMFQPVRVEQPLRAVFGGAIANVLAAGPALDPHGVAHHLHGLTELVLRSALRTELDRVDGDQARRREALTYIRANLADPALNADRVASAMFISRRRLYQLFDDGQGVSERIRQLRLDRAKSLLADPARAAQGVAEIAKACGFVSAAHFSRAFRNAVGRSPSEFRAR
jgi:AraC-like DNA-binding protein